MASSIPTSLSISSSQTVSLQTRTRNSHALNTTNPSHTQLCYGSRRSRRARRSVRASVDPIGSGDSRLTGNGDHIQMGKNPVDLEKPGTALQGLIGSLPATVFAIRNIIDSKIMVSLCVASTFLAIVARQIMLRKHSRNYQGSVADLVRRGQLRSDRRGISKPLKYEDPFNNPLVKAGKTDSTIEICGKLYRLAPVTLTKEEESIHKKRRSRAYHWKRPTTFLKEGESVPPDVDPDTVRWIPTNHPFATTVSDIDETLAQNNVYQKHGLPFRVKAEHEAMQKKLEALQNEQKLEKVEIDSSLIRDFERPFNPSSITPESLEMRSSSDQRYGHGTSKSDQDLDSSDNRKLQDKSKEL